MVNGLDWYGCWLEFHTQRGYIQGSLSWRNWLAAVHSLVVSLSGSENYFGVNTCTFMLAVSCIWDTGQTDSFNIVVLTNLAHLGPLNQILQCLHPGFDLVISRP